MWGGLEAVIWEAFAEEVTVILDHAGWAGAPWEETWRTWAESRACFGAAGLCWECLKRGLRLQTWRDRVMEPPASP